MENIKSCFICEEFSLTKYLQNEKICKYFPETENPAKIIIGGFFCQKFKKVKIVLLTVINPRRRRLKK